MNASRSLPVMRGPSHFLIAALLPSLVTLAATEAPSVAVDRLAGSRPNIVFVLTDDQGYGDLSCHGNPVLRTPNLDRLHAEGRRFTDFHVSPTCSPTRCALMTGRHEFKSGVTHTINERERMSLQATTLAQILHQAGYTNGIFGKWHLGDEDAYQPDRRGFDEVYIHGGGGIGQSYPGSCGDAPGNTYFNPALWHNGRFEKTQGYCADLYFAQAQRWINSIPTTRPFFAFITPNTPHEPLQCPPDYAALYAGRVGTNQARFFGMIANIDDNVGRLLTHLAATGREQRTLVLFMNDNGGTVGLPIHNAGMRGGKGTPFVGGTRAACFWRWPGTLPPGDIPALAAHVDVLPTLAALAGAQLPAQWVASLDGRSLLPVLADPAAPWPERTLFTHLGRWDRGQAGAAKYRKCSVRSGRYHLVSASARDDLVKAWQLYDLGADPAETRDCAADHPEVVARLDRAYDRWWADIIPCLENEKAVGPAQNPFKERYWRQFGGGPP
jgi:arylsulfatase